MTRRVRSPIIVAACAALVAAGCDAGGSSGDIADGQDAVNDATQRVADTYAESVDRPSIRLTVDPPEVRYEDVRGSGCADDEQRAARQIAFAVHATEDNSAVEDAHSVWNSFLADNDDLNVRDDDGSLGDAITTYAADDTLFFSTFAVPRDGYMMTLGITIATDGADGANIVVDAYTDCMPADG